jgi:hypothetical protein
VRFFKFESSFPHCSEKRFSLFFLGGQTIALHVERGAVKTSEYIAEKGGAYRSGLQPGQEPANISPVVQHGVYYLHKGSKGLAKVTQYLCKLTDL